MADTIHDPANGWIPDCSCRACVLGRAAALERSRRPSLRLCAEAVPADTTRLGELARLYVSTRRNTGEIGGNTARTYASKLRAFAVFLDVPPDRIRGEHLRQWMNAAIARSPYSASTEWPMVRSFCRWLVDQGHLEADPALGIYPPRAPRPLKRPKPRRVIPEPARPPKGTGSLHALVLYYIAARKARKEISGTSPNTYRSVLLSFADSTKVPPADLRRRHIEAWLESRPRCTAATMRHQLAVVRVFCRWLVLEGYVAKDPTLGVANPQAPRRLPRSLRPEQVGACLEQAPSVRVALILSLGVQEGLRSKEVAGLEVGDIDFRERQLLVRSGKGGHERLLPLSEETYGYLTRYLAERPAKAGPLIRDERTGYHKGVTAQTITALRSQAMHRAGIAETGHALRHTMAADALRNGAHLRDVQAALGHTSLTTTQQYLPLVVNDLREAMGGRTYRDKAPGPES